MAVWTAKQGIKFFFSGMESKVFEVCPLSIFFHNTYFLISVMTKATTEFLHLVLLMYVTEYRYIVLSKYYSCYCLPFS